MPTRVNVLGVGIHAVSLPEALASLEQVIRARERGYVCVSNVHTVMECQYDPYFRRAVNEALLAVPDGMPLVWIARRLGYPLPDRVYGPDLMLSLCERSAQQGYRNFFYGGSEDTLERLVARLSERFPGLPIVGAEAPPFRPLTPEEDAAAVARINAADPDVVWVGLGLPKQEKWMYEHRDRVQASLLIGVGAAFNFHAGTVAQAPRWMQKRGLEWAFRLLQEPRRLWRRYLFYNPLFIGYLALQWLKLRRFELE
jgi:N-acetylglucosaminyldiphosphoundecaprenol N-acetyl-beta-D-mannosaminyltransferase